MLRVIQVKISLTSSHPVYSYSACETTVDWDSIFNIAYYGRGLDSIYPYYILYDTYNTSRYPSLLVAKI